MSHMPGRPHESRARTHRPRTTRPHPHRMHGLDPVSLRRRRPLFTAGNLALFGIIVFFGLYAKGHLPGFDRFFDRMHAFGRAHNDVVVHGVLHWLPAGLVLSAAAVLGCMAFFAPRRRSAPRGSSPAIDDKALKAALASAVRASAQQAGSMAKMQQAEPLPDILSEKPPAPHEPITIHPFGVQQRIARRQAAKLRREALGADEARCADTEQADAEQTAMEQASAQQAVAEQAATKQAAKQAAKHATADTSLDDLVPTLPVHHRVRRRDPHGTLPPAVAAALKQEVLSKVK